VEKIVEEYKDIFTSPTGVHVHYQVKNSIDQKPDAPLPNDPVYMHSLMENEEIKFQIQEIILKGYIRPSSSPYGSPTFLVQKKDGSWRLCIDYKALKNFIVKSRYPIPHMLLSSRSSQGSQFFQED
jgi:hypothetical protein